MLAATQETFIGYKTGISDGSGPAAVIKVDLPDIAMVVKRGSVIHLMDGAVTIDVSEEALLITVAACM